MAAPDEKRERNPIASLVRVIAALTEGEAEGVGVRELGRILDSPPSSVQRTLEKAAEAGLTLQDEAGRWRLGWELFRIASLAGQKMPFAHAQPVLDALRDATGETAVLSVYDPVGGSRMFVASADSRQSIRFVPDLLTWMPMTAGATALVIAAARPPEEQRRLFAAAGRRGSWSAFSGRLREVVASGFAVSHDEVDLGASAVAAPILARAGGSVTSSLGIIAPAQRFFKADTEHLIVLVTDAARQLAGV